MKLEGNVAIIGITDHAQHALGDIVFVELPKIGADAKFMKTVGVVESVKAASDIYSPVSGKNCWDQRRTDEGARDDQHRLLRCRLDGENRIEFDRRLG